MKKIPVIFKYVFDEAGNAHIENKINERAEFLFEHKDAIPTFKKDGTAVMFDGEEWFVRRSVKPEKNIPEGYILVEEDPNTNIKFGWEPKENSSYNKMLNNAIKNHTEPIEPGTYELVAPKINKNPENVAEPTIMKHGDDKVNNFPTINEMIEHKENLIDFLEPFFRDYRDNNIEGIVWWVNNEPAVKLRCKDFYPEMDSRYKKH